MNWIPTNFNPLKLLPSPALPPSSLVGNHASYEKERPARSFPPFDRHHLLISFPRPSRPETHIRLSMERFLQTSEQNCFRSERLRCF